MIVPHCRA